MNTTPTNKDSKMKTLTTSQPKLYCENVHPFFDVECHLWGSHDTCEALVGTDEIAHWSPNALTDLGDRLVARNDDPDSSHAAAARDFDIPQGLRGMKVDIMEVAIGYSRWMTCRSIAEAIYGPGPYTYEEAVGINKVQTVALNLYREGHLSRRTGPTGVLEYAVKGTI
jgi:hypothetical protein